MHDDPNEAEPAFTFDWQFREHAAICQFLAQEQLLGLGWKLFHWGLVALTILATLLGIMNTLLGDPKTFLQYGPWVLLLLLVLAFVRRGTGVIRAWQTRRQDPNVNHPFTHALTSSGLNIHTLTTDVDLRWDGMHKVSELPDFFLFYYSKRIAYYLPKRVMGDQSQVDRVKELIRQRLPSSVPFVEQ